VKPGSSSSPDAAGQAKLRGRRLLIGYAVVAFFLAVAAIVSINVGRGLEHQPEIAGVYTASPSACLGGSFELTQSGQFVELDGRGPVRGSLRLRDGRLEGEVTCRDGARTDVDLAVSGAESEAAFSGVILDQQVEAAFAGELPEPGASAQPAKKRSAEETFGRLMLAIAAVILAARLAGVALARAGQPRVMGEILAGILLGPTLLGAVAPELKDYLFPADIIPLLSAGASIGLVFYLFLVGMELDPGAIRERATEAAFISNTSVAVPMALGMLVALPTYELLAPDADYLPFALFMGVAMSITAFPVLARILVERRMLRRPVGALAMAGAAIDDVTAWGLLALATAVAGAGSGIDALVVVGLAGVFTAAMILVGRRVLGRLSTAYEEVGHVPSLWIAGIFVAILLAAYVSQQIGIAPIFGAFIVGLVMPRHAGLTADVSRRLEDFVVTVLLPLFFVVTGLRVQVGALNRWQLWALALVLFAVAVAGKWLGAMAAARYGGFSWRDSAALGALMNTRGLTELIVLNIGLELGLISTGLFTMLVLMAIVTTFMAGPALRLLDPRGELSEPPEVAFRRAVGEEVAAGEQGPMRAILVAPQDDRNLDALLELAEPLARSQPPRELILVRLLRPIALSTGLVSEDRLLGQATAELEQRRELLLERGIPTRVAAFTAADPGADLVRLASEPQIDLVLINGRRPLLGEGVPGGEVGVVLERAPCDVAVLVDREGLPTIDEAHPVVVPFGGGEHDWAALELAAWIAASRGAKLTLLGAAATEDGRDASRLLANTSLVLQQLAGISAEPVLVTPGRDVLRAAAGAGLLVVGLSDRWRSEGLSPLRAEIAKNAPAATLFVRRGERPGALAPRDDMTRFKWSAANIAAPPQFSN
jgi:Kef-type K+ transport system membrane component KefB